MNPTEVTPTITPESTELSLADYRAMREGREVPKAIVDTTSSAADAAANADAETAVATDATETNSTEETSKDSKPAKSENLNRRFSELTAEIKTLKTQLAAKSGTGQTETQAPAEVPTQAAADPEPAADKFTDYVEWQKSWMKWQMRQEAREVKAAAVVAEQQNAAKAKAETWQTRVSEATAELADFATVAQNPELPVTQVMAEAITDSEVGPRILYHLGQHPELAAKIAKLSPVAQIREVGKIEAALAAEVAAADLEETLGPPVKKPNVSKAPAPHKPLGGSASSTNPAKQIESMTQAEYRAYRESGKLR